MLRVAAVGEHIAKHWTKPIDENSVVTTLLLHDLGNLLKFELEKGVSLFDVSQRNMKKWSEIQQQLRTKYSPDEHTTTQMMAREIGVSQRVLFLLRNMGSSHLHKTLETDDWELKLCSYADFRVAPDGFVTVTERFEDIMQRYKGRAHPLADTQKTLEKRESCLSLEKQLQIFCDVDLQKLPADELELNAALLEKWDLL